MKMAETIIMRPVEALIPYARNARTHSEAQVAQIAGSIREFGFTNPVLIDRGNGIIAGHGRVLAAHKLGITEVPCIELAHLSHAQRHAYIIADNKLALNAGWHTELLKIELEDLQLGGFDLALTGFDEFELGALFAETMQGQTDPDGSKPASRCAALPSAPRSSGPNTNWSSAAATTPFSTSRAFLPCARAATGIGPATENRRRCGRSPSRRNRRPATARKSRSSACAGRWRIIPHRGRRFMSRSLARARRSSPPR